RRKDETRVRRKPFSLGFALEGRLFSRPEWVIALHRDAIACRARRLPLDGKTSAGRALRRRGRILMLPRIDCGAARSWSFAVFLSPSPSFSPVVRRFFSRGRVESAHSVFRRFAVASPRATVCALLDALTPSRRFGVLFDLFTALLLLPS